MRNSLYPRLEENGAQVTSARVELAQPDATGPLMRLLLVEDNIRLAEFTASALRNAGFAVDAFHTADDALAALEVVDYDVAVFDLGLPDMDGMEMLECLRARRNSIPVLILTARDGLTDRVAGLNAGADDYLLKPFAVEELVARLRALLRRPGGAVETVMPLENVGLDPSRRQLTVDGAPVAITRREFDVMELLVRNAGRVVSKRMIDESIYGFDEAVTENSVEAVISRLRKRLRIAGARVNIVTIRGTGYVIGSTAP